MDIESAEYIYRVGDKVGANRKFTLYRSVQLETGRECMLQIAADSKSNGALDRLAFLLKQLRSQADSAEADFEALRERPDQRLNYHFGFPELVESFRGPEAQGRRRINIMAFSHTDRIREMVPLSNIVKKDRQRVDLQSSVWILGKFMKVVAFAHEHGVEVGRLAMSNLLILPDEHLVTIFDWSRAKMHPIGEVPRDTTREELSALARSIIGVLSGNSARRHIPLDTHEEATHEAYTDFLFQLAGGRWADAHAAHSEFYKLVDGLWPSGFHPFVTLPLDDSEV